MRVTKSGIVKVRPDLYQRLKRIRDEMSKVSDGTASFSDAVEMLLDFHTEEEILSAIGSSRTNHFKGEPK